MKLTRTVVVSAAVVGAMEYNPDACMDPSQIESTGADGKTRGTYRIPVPGKGVCNDIFVPYVKQQRPRL